MCSTVNGTIKIYYCFSCRRYYFMHSLDIESGINDSTCAWVVTLHDGNVYNEKMTSYEHSGTSVDFFFSFTISA